MFNRHRSIAEAMSRVMVALDILPHELDMRVPHGFWQRVFDNLPDDHDLESVNSMTRFINDRDKNGLKSNNAKIRAILDQIHTDVPTLLEIPLTGSQTLSEDDIRHIVREELSSIRNTESPAQDTPSFELVPVSDAQKGKRGRKLERRYRRLTITVDNALLELFKQEVATRQTSAPRLLDSILWHHYGRPKLSFE